LITSGVPVSLFFVFVFLDVFVFYEAQVVEASGAVTLSETLAVWTLEINVEDIYILKKKEIRIL